MNPKPKPARPEKPPVRARPSRLRLAPADRERQIIDGAIAYFSEVGFSGQTRELSSRLGITQPLLYRYFANKQALVERVYQTVFEGRWNPAWIALLQDRSVPLRERLIEFYRQYSKATYRPDWIRIYMHAGLSRPELNRRYIRLVRRHLMPVYCRELRHQCGLPDSDVAVSEQEIEFVWSLHGGIFYLAMRQHVYKTRIQVEFMEHVALVIDNFLAGASTTYPRLLANHAPDALGKPARSKSRVHKPSPAKPIQSSRP
ncbi:MAG: TetR/AcrR family transcriptional regulator [Ramlibacter sp.]|nr:TetR/AcrR family transcriptional regulator [Ramlibacter sp.]